MVQITQRKTTLQNLFLKTLLHLQLFVPLLRLIVKINKNKAINRKIVIQLKDINKTYNNGAPLHVLKGINLTFKKESSYPLWERPVPENPLT